MAFLVRISRLIPVLLVMGLLAVVLYYAVAYRRSHTQAKLILIKVSTIVNGVLSGVFALISLYAIGEHNIPVFELFFSCFLIFFIALVVTRVCNAVFLHHHPIFKKKKRDKNKDVDGNVVYIKGKKD